MAILFNKKGSATKYMSMIIGIVVLAVGVLSLLNRFGIMLSLGETEEEVYETMDDLLNIKCDILTIGQYLQPTKKQVKVQKYIFDEEFEEYKKNGISKGFKIVESGSLVRSSYHADRHLLK